jgi:hypothetical protein
MALQTANTNWKNGTYEADRNYNIQFAENDRLLLNGTNQIVHLDGKSRLAIGFGYDLEAHTGADAMVEINQYADPAHQVSQLQADILDAYNNKTTLNAPGHPLNGQVPSQQDVILEWGNVQLNKTQATQLLNDTVSKYETALSELLGDVDDIPQSKERAAIISLIYNVSGPTSNNIYANFPTTIDIILTEGGNPYQRAMLWTEIRYYRNGDRNDLSIAYGIQNRRNSESDLFGLFTSADGKFDVSLTIEEIKGTVAYLFSRLNTISSIINPEPRIDYVADFMSEISDAKTHLESLYTDSTAVDRVFYDEWGFGEEYEQHVNYVHLPLLHFLRPRHLCIPAHRNPVKHGYVEKAVDWKHSSIHRYIEDGIIDSNWGIAETIKGYNYGERT